MKIRYPGYIPLADFRHSSPLSFVWPLVASSTIITAIVAAYLIGARHDYSAYMEQWELILSGGDPWSTNNTYGPAYNLLAGLFALHPLLPKVIFVFTWQLSSWHLMRQIADRGVSMPWLIFWFAALPFNPLFWSFGVVYGSVDSLVAALCLATLASRQADRPITAALLLAAAVLLKIYPIVFAPFIALEGRRVNWTFVSSFAVLVAAGSALSLFVWGESTFYSITHNSERHSKMLSIFRFLRGDASPLKNWVDNLDHLSVPAVAVGGCFVFALSWKWRLPALSGAFAGILVTLLLYKVGHQQFFLVVPFAAGIWYVHKLPHGNRLLNGALVACMAWIAFMGALYLVTDYYARVEVGAQMVRTGVGLVGEWRFLRDWVGLPTFAILLTALVALIRYERLSTNRVVNRDLP